MSGRRRRTGPIRRVATRAKPWSKKAGARTSSVSDRWADEIERVMLDACHRKQRDFVLDDARLISGRVGRGGGKTTGQRARFLRIMARRHKARCVYITISRPVAEILMWAPLKDLCEALGLELGKDVAFNETKLTMTLARTGSTLRLVGADDQKEIDKLRGQPFDEVCIDEAAAMKASLVENLIDRVIGPRIGERKGTITMISTPGHILAGKFYDVTRPGSPQHRPYADRDLPEYAGWKRWSSHHWSLDDEDAQRIPALRNLWEDALEKKETEGWSDDNPIWKREYLGIWAADETDSIFKFRAYVDGAEWNIWDPKRTRKADLLDLGAVEFAELPPGPDGKPRTDWLHAVAMDHGTKNPFACNVFAVSPSDKTRTVYHVYWFNRPGMYARMIAVLLMGPRILENVDEAHKKPGGVIGAIGEWPAGMVADVQGLGELILAELSSEYGIRCLPAEQKGKHSAAELVNGDLVDGRMKILKGSPLAAQLGTLQWEVDKYGFPQWPRGVADHDADTLLYGRRILASLFDAIGTEGKREPAAERRPEPSVPTHDPIPQEPQGEFADMFDGNSFDSLFSDGGGSVDW